MSKVFWSIMVTLLFAFGLSVHAETPHVWDSVGVHPNKISRLDGVKVVFRNTAMAKELITNQFPDTVWIRKGTHLDVVTFGHGKRVDDVLVGFDSTRALRWTGNDGGVKFYLYEILGCTNLALEILPSVIPSNSTKNPASAPAAATTSHASTGVTFPWQNWLAALGLLALFGLLVAFLYWIFRNINATPAGGHTPPPTTAPMPPTTTSPTSPMTEEEFNNELGRHDENIRSLERMLLAERTQRQELINRRLRQLDENAQATAAEQQRLRNLRDQR